MNNNNRAAVAGIAARLERPEVALESLNKLTNEQLQSLDQLIGDTLLIRSNALDRDLENAIPRPFRAILINWLRGTS